MLIKKTTGTEAGRLRTIKSIIGKLPITKKQAIRLNVSSHKRISPYLEQCCVRASANVSYENAARDIEYYTGMKNKAICVDKQARKAWFQENDELVNWVNEQPLSDPFNLPS